MEISEHRSPVIPEELEQLIIINPSSDNAGAWVASVPESASRDPRIQAQYRKWSAEGLLIELKVLPPSEFSDLLTPETRSRSDAPQMTESQLEVVNLFRAANKAGASDIHINIPTGDAMMEMRINGALYPIRSFTREHGMSLLKTIYQSMCDLSDISFQEHAPQDGRLKVEFLKAAGLFGARYAHINTVGGVFAVMRLIPDDQRRPPSPEQLGFLPEQTDLLDEILSRPSGVILNSGPTGSGKSTTARSLIHLWLEQNRYEKRVITQEDPVEGAVHRAIQSPVTASDRSSEESISRAWSRGRAAIVRLDPDLVFIGEIRDNESAMATINFAESGHISMSTQHASSPLGNLRRLRILDVPVGFLQSSNIFAGLLAQRLLPTLCPHCSLDWETLQIAENRDVYGLRGRQVRLIERIFTPDEQKQLRFINRNGCEECVQQVMGTRVSQGISGRTVIAEVMRTTPEILQVFHAEGEDDARRLWIKNGGISMAAHAKQLALKGRVDPLMANELAPFEDDLPAGGDANA